MSLNFQICQQFIQLKQTNTNKNRWVSYSSFQSELNAQASISCCWFFVLFFHFVHLCLFVCVCVCASTHMCMHVCMCVMKYTHLKAFVSTSGSYAMGTINNVYCYYYISTQHLNNILREKSWGESFFLLKNTPIVLQAI